MLIRNLLILSLNLLLLSFLCLCSGVSEPAYAGENPSDSVPFKVKSVERYSPLNNFYKRTTGWIGADGAYSIPLTKERTLWTYGDTWIGVIKKGKRIKPKMINNTVSIQSFGSNDQSKMDFYWPGGMKKPRSVWIPGHAKDYYWPADGACVEGKLFLFLHKIRTNKKLPMPFQFETIGDDLSVVSNPLDPPANWKKKKIVLSNDSKTINYATACMVDGDYLYVYSNYPKAKRDLCPHPLIVSRILKKELAKSNLDSMEHYLEDGTWSSEFKNPKVLFFDAAPEMTVRAVKDVGGYIALYMPPLTKKIVLRFSKKPEGPFSKELLVYDCPEKEDSIILYSAKMHQELVNETMPAGTLIVTYCRNTRGMQEHIDKPEIYFPQALKVELDLNN